MQNTLRSNKHNKLTPVQEVTDADELVEFEPKDDENCDTEAITKDEEWITKKKTELTTTRQIETRIKRQVVLEDGKVVEDSGPIVSTNTTEDTDKQETETTEKRDLGIPDSQQNLTTISAQGAIAIEDESRQLAPVSATTVSKLIPRPADGLVRESNDKRVISHEEVKDYLETEDVRHLGDFSDETYINAINTSADNLEEKLISAANQKQLIPLGPKVIANTTKSRKTIDTDDTLKRCFAQPDGTLVTDSKNTTQHEVIVDEELPEKDDLSGGSHEKITTVEARQRFFKQRDEQNVDLLANGKVISTDMRYAAETMQMEKEGSLERPGDWDSLSDRMRKLRSKPQKSLIQQQKEAAAVALMLDRKDALTKRPLDFDREEETRKGETMKWLESHFGSESTASNDSREDAEVEPTKRTFFNVTIKSNHAHNETPTAATATTRSALEQDYQKPGGEAQGIAKTRYYQGAGGNWTERNNQSSQHFATQAFRDDLRETVERNRLKKGTVGGAVAATTGMIAREQIYGERSQESNYVSREDILQQKRQSLSSQFLARSKRGSVDASVILSPVDTVDHSVHDERERYTNAITHEPQRDTKPAVNILPTGRQHDYEYGGRVRKSFVENEPFDYVHTQTPRYAHEPHTYNRDIRIPSPEPPPPLQTNTLDRPAVPQRKRTIERRLRQQISAPAGAGVAFESTTRELAEPPPDYSPPPRSRSPSPKIDYILSAETRELPRNPHNESHYVNTRKLHQRTRFAPSSLTQHTHVPATPLGTGHVSRPKMSTQTTQTTPSSLSTSTSTAASHKSHSKMGQVIGNSLRKLVSKIRSASAERKFRMKSKSKSREQSPAAQHFDANGSNGHATTTYQQYNLIDSHIGGRDSNANDSEHDSGREHTLTKAAPIGKVTQSVRSGSSDTLNRETKSKSVSRTQSSEFYANQRELESMLNPRQRYYLGEDPYSSTLYGKENMYDPGAIGNRTREPVDPSRNNRDMRHEERPKPKNPYMQQRNVTSNTLGRFQKSGQRVMGSTPNLSHDYRSAKTLPRKLADHQEYAPHPPNLSSQTDGRSHYHATATNSTTMGPAKPARSYAKSLSRSKSFNLHGLNGSTENTPVYIEKTGQSRQPTARYQNSTNPNSNYGYRREQQYNVGVSNSNESSLLQSGLKSPSIVNLVSRSQKDLSKIGLASDDNEYPTDMYDENSHNRRAERGIQRDTTEKKKIFLKGLHQQAPDLYRTLHDDEYRHEPVVSVHKYPLKAMHSLESRSPIQINKDTASIIRGTGQHHHHSNLTHKERVHMYMDDHRRRGSGSTIIEVNRK